MTPPSAGDMPLNTRVPREDIDRADRLAERLGADPRVGPLFGGRPSRAAILRLAIRRGLDAIEAEYPDTSTG